MAEDIKERDREATGLDWDLKEVRLLFIWPSQNMASMKDTVAVLSTSPCH